MGEGSPVPPRSDGWPDAGGSAGGAGGLGLDPAGPVVRVAGGRCPVEAAGHPADGQAGLGWPVTDPAGLDSLVADLAGGRPAPRDQPEAAVDALVPPEAALDDPLPPEAARGGRSSGGAVRLAPPLAVALPRTGEVAPASLRELELGPPSPSAAGGTSGRNRDA
jgi:hypothetical protein